MFYLAKIVDPATSEEIDYEYWIDSDTEHKVTGKGTTGDYVFNIDVSALEKGTHTFNFRAKDLLEQWGETFIGNFTIIPKKGDVNEDGEVNVGDIVSVCNVMAGISTVDPQLADVNSDGEVNVGDIVTICNIMAGNDE